jgi:predicted lysophospholipase L1 biosynthesis ABC-type transport system permease subunit
VVPVAEAGGSVFPILLGMAAIFGLASLAITGDHTNGEINLPVSP